MPKGGKKPHFAFAENEQKALFAEYEALPDSERIGWPKRVADKGGRPSLATIYRFLRRAKLGEPSVKTPYISLTKAARGSDARASLGVDLRLVKAWMQIEGLTGVDLAQQIGCEVSTLARHLAGERLFGPIACKNMLEISKRLEKWLTATATELSEKRKKK